MIGVIVGGGNEGEGEGVREGVREDVDVDAGEGTHAAYPLPCK